MSQDSLYAIGAAVNTLYVQLQQTGVHLASIGVSPESYHEIITRAKLFNDDRPHVFNGQAYLAGVRIFAADPSDNPPLFSPVLPENPMKTMERVKGIEPSS